MLLKRSPILAGANDLVHAQRLCSNRQFRFIWRAVLPTTPFHMLGRVFFFPKNVKIKNKQLFIEALKRLRNMLIVYSD